MTGLIELKLSDLNQLFNSMDPSPFHERDLDRNAEEFIVSWAREHPRHHELKLVIHLFAKPLPETGPNVGRGKGIGRLGWYQARRGS